MLVGVNRAKRLLLGAEVLSAAEAVEIGLATEVAEDPLAAAAALAARWATLPPFALQSTKSILNVHLKEAASRALGYGLALEEQSMAGPEFAAGPARRRSES